MSRDALFLFHQYLDIHSYLLPLGVIGMWRWSVWLFKEIVALRYRPQTKPYKATVSAIIPVYNENPKIFKKALATWNIPGVSEIIAVIDYSDTACIQIFKEFAKKNSIAKLIVTKTPGKRPALADGIKAAKSEIVALIDSDTLWDIDVIKNGLPPFHDKKVAGVATYQNVLAPKTMAQKIFDIHLDLRYCDDFAFLAAGGDALNCLSGRTAFYRRSVVVPMLDDLVNETFRGTPVISGDDKRLTYLVLEAGWKTAYQSTSHVYTPGMPDLLSYLQQRLRWSRNSLRADLRALGQRWVWKHKALVFFQLDKVAQAFVVILSPIYFCISLYMGLYVPATIIGVWWVVSRAIKMYPHLKRRPMDIFLLPVYIIYSFFTAIVKAYAFFSLNTQGWITRWDKSRMPQLQFMKMLPAYAETILFIVMLITSVYFYRHATYLQPREAQAHLVAKTLPTVEVKPVALPNAGIQTESPENFLIRKYVVENGDTLGSVAYKFGISADNLLVANVARLTNWNTIEPGFILSIPAKDMNLINPNKFNYQRIYPDTKSVTYDPTTNIIDVRGRGTYFTLSDIKGSVSDELLQEVAPKEWLLNASIYIHPGVTLSLDKDEVSWLKLASNKDNIVYLRASSGVFEMNGVKITSWDETAQDYDKDITDKRAYILVKDNSRMDIYNSELAYLGFSRELDPTTSPYGVSWRMSNGKRGQALLTGEIINTKFHNNYFGAYTFGATGMLWKGNEFYDNIRYGLDPHDDSNGFLVENNKAHNNGSHGIIFSKRCINNTIRNNISYDNTLHGIMLHEKSNHNVITNNVLYGNNDGIALWHSSNNLITDNSITDNKRGVRANVASNQNVITNNRMENTKQYGIYFYTKANGNVVSKNIFRNGNTAVYVSSSDNHFSQNIMEDNSTGVYLLGNANNNTVTNNTILYNTSYGIYSKINTSLKNSIGKNTFYRNRHDVIANDNPTTLSAAQ